MTCERISLAPSKSLALNFKSPFSSVGSLLTLSVASSSRSSSTLSGFTTFFFADDFSGFSDSFFNSDKTSAI
jgi:hypothetical protein